MKDSDLRIEFMRSQGAGGQSVNTTDSACRVIFYYKIRIFSFLKIKSEARQELIYNRLHIIQLELLLPTRTKKVRKRINKEL